MDYRSSVCELSNWGKRKYSPFGKLRFEGAGLGAPRSQRRWSARGQQNVRRGEAHHPRPGIGRESAVKKLRAAVLKGRQLGVHRALTATPECAGPVERP